MLTQVGLVVNVTVKAEEVILGTACWAALRCSALLLPPQAEDHAFAPCVSLWLSF